MTEDLDTGQPVTQQGVTAVVKWFNPFKGFGFVRLGEDQPDAFLHASVLVPTGHQELPEGTTIICDVNEGPRGLQVAAITSIEEIPETPPMSDSRPEGALMEGTVKFYNHARGFGFVIPDDGSRDVFVSARTLERAGLPGLEANQRVRLSTRVGHKGPMAQSVEVI
jgi:CspA family cold shock protein